MDTGGTQFWLAAPPSSEGQDPYRALTIGLFPIGPDLRQGAFGRSCSSCQRIICGRKASPAHTQAPGVLVSAAEQPPKSRHALSSFTISQNRTGTSLGLRADFQQYIVLAIIRKHLIKANEHAKDVLTPEQRQELAQLPVFSAKKGGERVGEEEAG